MAESLRAGGKVLAFGNGGSAADAQHLAAELVGRYLVDRAALPAHRPHHRPLGHHRGRQRHRLRGRLPPAGGGARRPGDVAHRHQHLRPLAQRRRGAARRARARGLVTVGLTGGGGGALRRPRRLPHRRAQPPTRRASRRSTAMVVHVLCQIVEEEPVARLMRAGRAPPRSRSDLGRRPAPIRCAGAQEQGRRSADFGRGRTPRARRSPRFLDAPAAHPRRRHPARAWRPRSCARARAGQADRLGPGRARAQGRPLARCSSTSWSAASSPGSRSTARGSSTTSSWRWPARPRRTSTRGAGQRRLRHGAGDRRGDQPRDRRGRRGRAGPGRGRSAATSSGARPPHLEVSLLAAAWRLRPAGHRARRGRAPTSSTCTRPAIPAALGRATHLDFRILAGAGGARSAAAAST